VQQRAEACLNAPAAPAASFRIRQARFADFQAVLDFYVAHKSRELPIPTAKVVGDALERGRILVVQPRGEDRFVAAAAVFQLTPEAALTYSGELGGMRATGAVGGLEPVPMQVLLLGLRLLGHAALEPKAVAPGATMSLITIVEHTNARSIQNINSVGMKPMVDRPAWLKYDEHAWYGGIVQGEWLYYFADNDTMVKALDILVPVGVLQGKVTLGRIERNSGTHRQYEFHLELADIAFAARDLERIRTGRGTVDLVRPPESIAFPGPQ
jgi:hypothetical protein